MLVKPTIDELLPLTGTRYSLAVISAKRARQLVGGALPLTDKTSLNPVSTASEEIAEGKVVAVKGSQDVEVPLRPEVIEAMRLASEAKEEHDRAEMLREDIESVAAAEPVGKTPEPGTLDINDLAAAFDAAQAQLKKTDGEYVGSDTLMSAVDAAIMGESDDEDFEDEDPEDLED